MGSQGVGEGEKPSSNSGHEEDVLEKLKQSVDRTLNTSMRDMLHACLEEQTNARSQGPSRTPLGSSRSSQESYESRGRREYMSNESSREFEEEDTKETACSGNESRQEDSEQVRSPDRIEEYICSVLGVPEGAYKEYKERNGSAEFFTELIRFRIEQEKTKQDSLKHQFTILTLDILRFAKSLNLDRDLIPLLFVSNKSLADLKTQVHQFQKEPETLIKDLMNIVQLQDIGKQWATQDRGKMEPSPRPSQSRLLPSFSETEEIIRRPSSVETPHASSPNKLPDEENKKLNTFPSSIERSHSYSSQQCSPLSIPFTHQSKYPKLHLHGHFASKPNKNQLNTSLPVPQVQNKNEAYRSPENKSMGSPESPQYVPYMVPPPPSTQNYSPASGSNYLQPQARYPYIFPLSSRHNQQGQQQHAYMMSSSVPIGMMPPTMSSSSYNYYPYTGDKTKRTSSLKEEDYSESLYHYKRPRHGKPGFNFMISTPKNPPANKYNNNAAKDHSKK